MLSPDPTAALRVSVVYIPGRCRHLPTWPLLAALVGELPPVRRGRRGPPLHAVPRPQGSRQHYVLSRSLLGRARRSAAWLVNRAASHPRAYGARPIPSAVARLRLFPRATVIGGANGRPTRYGDPALLTEVAGQLPRQRPMRCRYRDLDLLSPVGRPRPPPQEVRLNRCQENSEAVFPPTNPAHIPA